MALPSIALASLLLAAQAPPPTQESFAGLTLNDVARLPRDELARRAESVAGGDYRFVSVDAYRGATSFIFRTPAVAAGRGLCGARRLEIVTNPATDAPWRLAPGVFVSVPPDGWHTTPLRIVRREERAVFYLLPPRSTSRAGSRGRCARVSIQENFFAAADARAARRGAAILAAFREQRRRDPDSVRADCFGTTRCIEDLVSSSINAFASVEECGSARLPPARACAVFHKPDFRTMYSFQTEAFHLGSEADASGRPRRVVTLLAGGVMID